MNMINTEEAPMRWIPKAEYDLMMQRQSLMSPSERQEEMYFFWNNCSMEGYEEWKEEQELKKKDKI